MPINDIGSMNKIFNSYNAKDWTQSASINEFKALDFQNLNKDLGATSSNKSTFAQMLTDSIAEVNNLQVEANTAVQKLVSGESKNLHETILAVEQAEIAFKTMNQIRLKVIDAYKEVMRMQI